MVIIWWKKTEKFRSPLLSTLNKAAGALTHRTGRNLYDNTPAKNEPRGISNDDIAALFK